MNTMAVLNLNIRDDIGISFTSLSKNNDLKGTDADSKFWIGLNYRSNF